MSKRYLNKQYSYYLGEQRPILDIIGAYEADPTPTPTPTPTIPPTPSFTPTPTPTPTPTVVAGVFKAGDGFDDRVYTVLVDQADNDTLYVGGVFTYYKNTISALSAKIDKDGNLNSTYASQHPLLPGSGVFYGSCEDETGDYIYIWGNWIPSDGQNKVGRIQKINKSTGVDAWEYGPSFTNAVFGLCVDPNNGDVYAVGNFTVVADYQGGPGQTRNRIVKFDKDGVIDTGVTFGTGIGNNTPYGIIFNDVGNLVVYGSFTSYQGAAVNRILEIDISTQTKTAKFGTGSSQSIFSLRQYPGLANEYIGCMNAGTIDGISVDKVFKLDSSGTAQSYGPITLGGIIPTGAWYDNGYIYITHSQGVGIRRYDYSTAVYDAAFEANISTVYSTSTVSGNNCQLSFTSDNKIYFGGVFTTFNDAYAGRIVRLNFDGTADYNTL